MRIIILLSALASTISTTGYSIALLIYALFQLRRFSVKSVASLIIALPFAIHIYSLDFMREKVQDRFNFEGLTNETMHDINYNAKTYGDEYLGSFDRFESAYFDWINFLHEPLLGYGRNTDHSWFCQEISKNFWLAGGFVKILSQYGIFIGVFLYAILFYSSYRISMIFRHKHRFIFAVALIASSISYPVFSIPIFTAFWLYGLFC